MNTVTCPLLSANGSVLHVQGAKSMVKIRFSPKDSRVYHATVPLYVGEDTATAYYSLELTGEGKYPRLTFDTKEVIMPSVPLNFTSKATFYVISQGYDNLQLHVSPCCSLDSQQHALHACLAGTVIGLSPLTAFRTLFVNVLLWCGQAN